MSAWSMPVSMEDIDEAGRHFDLAADETTRAQIAGAIGVRALPRLSASLDVTRHGRDGLHVTGEVTATVSQTCVVTLEPMESELCEAVDLVFAPRPAVADPGTATPLEIGAGEPPEILDGGIVDLGAVAMEFLLLGLDPYPRKPGVRFDAPAVKEPSSNPFAALAALKTKPDEGKQ